MRQKRKKIIFIICSILLFLLEVISIIKVWNRSIGVTKDRAIGLAKTAEAGIQTELLAVLEADAEDVHKSEYDSIKKGLMKLTGVNSNVIYSYLYRVMGDKIILIADSEPIGSASYLPPGSELPAREQDRRIYEDRITAVTKSGLEGENRISVLTPVIEDKSGTVMAILGMDYNTKAWYAYAKVLTFESGVNGLFIILLLHMGHFAYRKQKEVRADRNKLKEVNRKLYGKEQIFHALFEQAPYGISFGNSKSYIVDSNLKFQHIVGRTKEELKNMSWMDISHPDDLNKDLELFERFRKGEIDGYQLDKRYTRPDQSVIWVKMSLSRIMLDYNDAISHICIFEDITDQKRAEANLKESERNLSLLLSNLPGMAYRCNYDRDWTMQFVSEGCYELTGYPPESLLHNRDVTFNEIIADEHRDFLWKKWTEVLQNHEVFKEEYAITTAANEVKWVFEQGQGVYNEQGEIEAIEGLIIDISKQRKREDEILFLTYHDVLTGLYNRRYYEEAKLILDRKENYPLSVIVGDVNGLKLINSAMGHQEGDVLIQKVARILEKCCRPGDILARTGGDEFSIFLPNTTYEEADRIIHLIGKACEEEKKYVDEAYHPSISVGCATKTEKETDLASIIKAAEESMYRHKLLQNKSLHSSLINTMKTSLFEKSQETEAHARRLIDLSKAVGEILKLTEEQLNELELLSTLHDIGKIGISDSILNKPGKLTEEEWVEMKRHPEMGYRIAMSTPELAPIADYILSHHERWDGKGYPYGRKGEEIPLLSRIIAIADSYDAMTSDRPYRKAISREEAIEEIRRNAGTQFDPYLCDIFINQVLKEEDLG
jgi:diguanylate cyclase (GGDEF)-like protein/PAS domain S-box-containing protein